MSTFSRASSTTSATTYDVEAARHEDEHVRSDCIEAEPRRQSSLFVPLFGNFQWNNSDSAVALPIHESEPAYQEALANVEEDPDFVEVEIEPKAGSMGRRTSVLANIFSNKDIDVDPDLKFEPSTSEVEIKQGIAKAQTERSLRKMVYSRNLAVMSLATINAIGIALSFGLFSVWYAVTPMILLAPLLRSAMVFNLLGSHAYTKTTTLLEVQDEREKAELPIMDYATVVAFSNESFEDIQSTLDSVVDQKDVDMHKNLLLISCNDNVWNAHHTKSTTRIILENILTNIVDEAKFQMPREDQDSDFDTMWCRRGIYKGLPYVLMIKEGVTKKTEVLDLTRNLLYAYNLRKDSYFNSVPSAFFAWCKEWAELHDFASFDFLVNLASDTLLDEHCISQMYSQSLENPTSAGILSRVEVDFRSHTWSLGSLYSNSHLMYDQVRSSHQTQVTHTSSADLGACHMIKVCEETCGLRVLGETKQRRASPMSNMVKQMSSSLEDDDMMYGVPEVTTLQAVHAVAYTRPATTCSEFFAYHQRIAFSFCATNLAVICNKQMHWFERLSSAAELLAWCLPIFSLTIIINFLRSAALQQNIPVLIVLSAIVASPWIYAAVSAMWLARSWDARLRYVLGFVILILTGPLVTIYVFASTVLNLHRLRPEQPKRRRSSAVATQIQHSNV
jgi:chitin synthase